MLTTRRSIWGPGTFARKRSEAPSSGWIRRSSRLGSRVSTAVEAKGRCGAGLKWIATSVARRGRRLPVRR